MNENIIKKLSEFSFPFITKDTDSGDLNKINDQITRIEKSIPEYKQLMNNILNEHKLNMIYSETHLKNKSV
jgi:hypothetical protein